MLPAAILKIIHAFAAYTPEEWQPVAEYDNTGNYGWLPQPAIDLPMW